MVRILFLLLALLLNGCAIKDYYLGDTYWTTSCGVDSGSIERSENSITFKDSANHCGNPAGGQWASRSEIFSTPFSVSKKFKATFETTLSVFTKYNQKFTLFQIHDGRSACAPPFKLDLTLTNQLKFVSDLKIKGRGEGRGCWPSIGFNSLKSDDYNLISRDGRKANLRLEFDFDGKGNFDVSVFVDGKLVLDGRYDPQKIKDGLIDPPNFEVSKKFQFKHGIYARNRFDIKMVSENIKFYITK